MFLLKVKKALGSFNWTGQVQIQALISSTIDFFDLSYGCLEQESMRQQKDPYK